MRRHDCWVLYSLSWCLQSQTISAKDRTWSTAQVHIRVPVFNSNGCRWGSTRHFLRTWSRTAALMHLLRTWKWIIPANQKCNNWSLGTWLVRNRFSEDSRRFLNRLFGDHGCQSNRCGKSSLIDARSLTWVRENIQGCHRCVLKNNSQRWYQRSMAWLGTKCH